MIIKFKVDIKIVRKCFALIGEDIPADEILVKKLSKVIVDLSEDKDPDIKEAEMGFTLMAIGKAFT